MSIALKYIISTIGLVAVAFVGIGATANLTDVFATMKGVFPDPTNALVYSIALIGVVSFVKKFLADVFQWFSTGLNSKN